MKMMKMGPFHDWSRVMAEDSAGHSHATSPWRRTEKLDPKALFKSFLSCFYCNLVEFYFKSQRHVSN